MNLHEAIAATAELCGQPLSRPALAMIALDLDGYPPDHVLGALRRCRSEHKGRLTVEAIISRLDDGRPGAEEAWAMMPKSESASVVWTDEMAEAFGVASALLDEGDAIAARMAFREVYQRLVSEARVTRKPTVWRPSLGWDFAGRETALRAAVEKRRITADRAQALLPAGRFSEDSKALPAPDYAKRLAGKMSVSGA